MRVLIRRFVKDVNANVAMIFALASVPILFLTGMGVDYGMAAGRQSQLNAFADSAALAAVTPTMMAQDVSAAETVAQNTFNAQASALAGINYSPSSLSVAISTSGSVRTVTVTYAASYTTMFPNLLGMTTIPLGGTATATAGLAPDINFYLLLDDSPSMAIGATQYDINTLVAKTQSQCDGPPSGGSTCGCAFACHETNPAGESHCNSYTCGLSGLGNPGGVDNYALARSLGLTLRIDLVRSATQDLMSTAQATEAKYNANYQVGIYTFDVGVNKMKQLTADFNAAKMAAANISMLKVYQNNYLAKNNRNGDTDTDFDTALNYMNNLMPNPGSGTGSKGDTPQEVLFIVTDGVANRATNWQPLLSSFYGSYCCGNRQQSTFNPLSPSGQPAGIDWCTSIKNRGIRIAVLYTEYLPLPNNGWYNSYIKPIQSNISKQLESCASPGLFYEVTTGGDISAALASLFQTAVQTAYLSK